MQTKIIVIYFLTPIRMVKILFKNSVCMLSYLIVSDCVTPWTIAHEAPLSMGFSRQEYWTGLPFPSSGDLPDPRIESTSFKSPALADRFFTTSTTWKAQSNECLWRHRWNKRIVIATKCRWGCGQTSLEVSIGTPRAMGRAEHSMGHRSRTRANSINAFMMAPRTTKRLALSHASLTPYLSSLPDERSLERAECNDCKLPTEASVVIFRPVG